MDAMLAHDDTLVSVVVPSCCPVLQSVSTLTPRGMRHARDTVSLRHARVYLCHLLMMIRYAVVYHHHHQQQQHEKQQRQQQQRQQQWKDDNAYGKYAASSEVTLHTAEPTSLPLCATRRGTEGDTATDTATDTGSGRRGATSRLG